MGWNGLEWAGMKSDGGDFELSKNAFKRLPKAIQKKLADANIDPRCRYDGRARTALTSLNDEVKLNFKEIAQVISVVWRKL